jgi:FtsH-binding integral membrane protein
MTPAPHARPGPRAQRAKPAQRRAPSRKTAIAIAAEAATFAVASATHFATGFIDAAIPELVIAAVLGTGSSAVFTRRARAWGIATGTAAFATFGTIVGLTIIATGRQDVPDLTYHASILAALAVTLTVLLRQDGDEGRPNMNPREQIPLLRAPNTMRGSSDGASR